MDKLMDNLTALGAKPAVKYGSIFILIFLTAFFLSSRLIFYTIPEPRACVWTAIHSKGFALKSDLYKSVKKAFDPEGTEIPCPCRTLVLKNKADNL